MMTPSISALLGDKQLYKFSGPPENWLSAIRFMTWGLKEEYKKQWAGILPGDIFLMHSMSTNTKVKDAQSSIIGFGVVGDNPSIKKEPLWLQEHENNSNIWPLLVPFSEIYLFSPQFQGNSAPEPRLSNIAEVIKVSRDLLSNTVPLASIRGFPQMGSMSRVRPEVVEQIFQAVPKLFVLSNPGQEIVNKKYISTPLVKFDKVEEQARYATTLQTLDLVKQKTFTTRGGTYSKDPILLERADQAHQATVQKLRDYFATRGYDTYFNKHVDLFAANSDRSYLFEVKSNENRNFLSQARKSISQLFEYEYFEVQKYHTENDVVTKVYKNVTFSSPPDKTEYIDFMNSINLGISYFNEQALSSVGKDVGISTA